MIRRLTLGLLLIVAAPVQAAGWKTVFQDTFDGTKLDQSKWATRYIYDHETLDHLHDERQVFRDKENHVVKDGVLSLIARPIGAQRYESGVIRTRQTFYYGYFEARVFLPKGKGVWPDFWLNPDYDGDGKLNWPPEIDVYEYVINGRDNTSNMFHSAASIDPANPNFKYLYTDPEYDTRRRDYIGKTPLNEAWHVFGLAWTPETLTVFLDGKRIYTRTYKWLRKDGTLGGPAHVLFNFAVGGSWAGRYGIDENAFPQAYKIDYVRICQISQGPDGGRTCGGSKYTPDPAVFGYKSDLNDLPKARVGAAKADVARDGAKVSLPITLFPGYKNDRSVRIALVPVGDDSARPVATGQQPILSPPAGGGQINATVMVKPGKSLAPGKYNLIADILAPVTPGGSQTPLVCAGPVPMVKSVTCQVGMVTVR